LAGIIVSGGFGGSVLAAQPVMAQTSTADAAIVRSFRRVARREPTERELLRYRSLMVRNGWTEADVRRDLAARTDYRTYRNDNGTRPSVAVRSAYHDVLGREPDAEGLRTYRDKMIREGWSEQDVRDALRRSEEYGATDRRTASADRIIRRAYLDVLNREPDPDGLQTYRREILENGWEYQDLRQALMRSPERRQNRSGTRESRATDMVSRAYRSVLGREPDAGGLQNYRDKVLREGWTEAQVIQSLRESEEYRIKHR
jgi:hypothetical protein